ncbi:hypothetical protein Tco_0924632 [Tanacetum coccineum]|uniref:Reverse transcriptase zinc-binding domain-containing protein n=1 Tax=Tanacetum coccineum TaxID=301880 RepID=A0ABQ5D7F0_9ASTR
MKGLAGLNTTSHDIYAISVSLFPIAKQRTTRGVIAKLVLAACAYFLWQECNWRLFKKLKRSSTQIIDCINSVVHLKLLSCRFKKSRDGLRMARLWDLPAAMFRLKEEKARRHGKVYNWETATYGRIWYDNDVRDLRSVESEFPSIVFNDQLTSELTLLCEPTISSLNEIKLTLEYCLTNLTMKITR